jgi:hypothetical protein
MHAGAQAKEERVAPIAVLAEATAAAAEAAAGPLQEYSNEQQQYKLLIPGTWERKGKAGG